MQFKLASGTCYHTKKIKLGIKDIHYIPFVADEANTKISAD